MTRSDDLERQEELERLRWLATWLDGRFIDPLLGLVLPGVGDMLGSLLGLYGVWVAWRRSAHPVVVARMLLNLAADALLGSIPILGAIGDFFFRAHTKNLELLEARRDPQVTFGDWLIVSGAALLFLSALIVPVVLAALLFAWLFRQF